MSRTASIVTILSLGIAPVWYFWKKQRDTDEERSRASRNLYGELNDALEGLDDNKHAADFRNITLPPKKVVYYMNRFLNHDIYDSLISSGKINFLTYELQQEVQDIFNRIKKHNYYITLISEMLDKVNGIVNEPIYSYCELMDNYEKRLLKDIPDMMERLKKDFKFKPINN